MLTREDILKALKLNKPKLLALGIKNVGLFGSYSYNQQTVRSDIDLLIDFESGRETFDNLMAACDLLQEIFINEKVEVVTRNGLSPYIGPKILDEVQYA